MHHCVWWVKALKVSPCCCPLARYVRPSALTVNYGLKLTFRHYSGRVTHDVIYPALEPVCSFLDDRG